jgi:hypothetical protein
MKKFNAKKRAAQSTRGVQLSFSFSSVVKYVRGRRDDGVERKMPCWV